MRKPIWLIAATLLATPMTAWAISADTGLPDPADVAAALDGHPAVVAAEARTVAARAEAEALAHGTQEFTLTTGFTQRSIDREGRYDEFDATLTRPIRLPGKGAQDRAAGRYGLAAAQNRAEDARHQTALLLANSWWDWVVAAAETKVARQSVANHTSVLAAVRRRVALRDAAQLEADLAEAALGSAALLAEQAAGREAVARARLAARFPLLPLPSEAPDPPQPQLPDGGVARFGEQIVARSHEIGAAQAEAQRMEALAQRARLDRLADPSLGLRLFSERGGAERGAGVVVSLPLGGRHRRDLANKSGAEASAAQAEAQAVRFAVNEMAAADMAEALAQHQAWTRARAGLEAQVAALAKLRRGQAAGEIGLADVLLGERQVHDAFRAEAVARAEAGRAITRMQIDSHELWISD